MHCVCDVCVPYATAARALSEYYLHNSFFDNKFLANVKAIANILEQRERVEKKNNTSNTQTPNQAQ